MKRLGAGAGDVEEAFEGMQHLGAALALVRGFFDGAAELWGEAGEESVVRVAQFGSADCFGGDFDFCAEVGGDEVAEVAGGKPGAAGAGGLAEAGKGIELGTSIVAEVLANLALGDAGDGSEGSLSEAIFAHDVSKGCAEKGHGCEG